MKSLLVFLSSLCIPFAAASQTLDVRNPRGLRISVDTDDRNPALIIVVPDGPESARSSKILFPEHVTVRAHGQSEQEHLYIFRAGNQGYSPEWKKSDNALEYTRDFGQIHFVARATLREDGIIFHYEFANNSEIDYDVATAITDPRFHAVFYDPRLQRTYVHHEDGFDLLASETPGRLATPLRDWFPARYLASYRVPVPKERVQHREDGITYYYKSRAVDVPMIATLSEDRTWVAASFARDPGNVWSNPELTCQHVDPEVPLPHKGHAAYEVKILIFKGSLEDALHKVLAQRSELEWGTASQPGTANQPAPQAPRFPKGYSWNTGHSEIDPATGRRSVSGWPTIREPSRVVSQIEMPSATTSAGSASTRHKAGVFPPAIVSIRRFGYKHLLRSVGTASSIHTGARSALTCCFPKGSVPFFLLETKMAVHR